jgi:HSP20 family molecular chaperone IbpA
MSKNSTIIGAALIALAVGVGIGVGATEFKSGPSSASNAAKTSNPAANTPVPQAVSPVLTDDPFQQIRDMQMQMDKLFSQMSAQFRSEPQFKNISENPAYSLSLNVENLKDRFVVHALVPDTKASDVNVKLDKQTLKVDVSNQEAQVSNQKNEATRVAEWGQYEQVIQLPSPVKASQMKIERKDHELVITLPKA